MSIVWKFCLFVAKVPLRSYFVLFVKVFFIAICWVCVIAISSYHPNLFRACVENIFCWSRFLKVGLLTRSQHFSRKGINKKTQHKQCQTPNAKRNPLQSEKLQRQNILQIGLHTMEKLSTLVWAIWRQIICFLKYDHLSNKVNYFFGLEQWLINKTHGCMGWFVCVHKKWGWIAVAQHKYQKQNKENKTKLPTIHLRGCHWALWWKWVGQDTGFRLLVYKLIWVGSPSRTQTPLVFGPVKRFLPVF